MASDLKKMIKEELRCEVAEEKEAVVASSASLAEKVRIGIGAGMASRAPFAANLGVDFSAGRKRGKRAKGTVRGTRFAKGKRRRKRLQTLRKLLGPRIAGHIFAAGLLPSIAYGADVNGVSDREWGTLQKIGAAAHSAGTGRSLAATLLLRGDATWKAAAAPCLQWQKEVWDAHGGHPRGQALFQHV